MKPVRNILVIHQGAIGDFILSLPAFFAFRYNYPGASITIWGHQEILRLVQERFYADKTFSIEHQGLASLYTGEVVVPHCQIERLRSFDLVFVFGGKLQVPLVDGLKRLGLREVYHIAPFPTTDNNLHVTDFQLSQLRSLGITVTDTIPRLFPNREDEDKAKKLLAQYISPEIPTVALHPGSGSRKKSWSLQSFVTLLEKLLSSNRVQVIVPLGPAEEESIMNCFKSFNNDLIIPMENYPLDVLAAILKRCHVYVGNDSGITHIAAAVGIPVVAIFGPTNPLVWGPRGKQVTIVYGKTACSPCPREKMYSCTEQECMKRIKLEEVYGRVIENL